ncbi:uncharacterized protein F5Z01DRAFT_659663 [Emericellopsis atlantica]|uniref:Uncharacterized protein n=1 Tax=Emericellopsis atlantica TaxID=2614577 RepID=A0A9P8CN75_9HYPO|nr:uncharacterized protein F5Z01DRAFT_659663 [Emericellopsis atlantica]KAG9252867.1 hypothetical protein F5Z01DRAFT_659663 [Emericellopsis atlantica]
MNGAWPNLIIVRDTSAISHLPRAVEVVELRTARHSLPSSSRQGRRPPRRSAVASRKLAMTRKPCWRLIIIIHCGCGTQLQTRRPRGNSLVRVMFYQLVSALWLDETRCLLHGNCPYLILWWNPIAEWRDWRLEARLRLKAQNVGCIVGIHSAANWDREWLPTRALQWPLQGTGPGN